MRLRHQRRDILFQALETSLRAWEEKQRNTLNIATQSTSTISNTSQPKAQLQISKPPELNDEELSILFSFIEAVTTLVKWVKLLIISHPSLEPDLYQVASRTAQALEQVHPDGKILEGVSNIFSSIIFSKRYRKKCIRIKVQYSELSFVDKREFAKYRYKILLIIATFIYL